MSPRHPSSRQVRQIVALTFVLLAAYSYFFPRWGDWNQNSRFDLVVAIVDDHALSIDPYVGNTGDYALHGDHFYSDKAPGLSLLAVPIYSLFRHLVPFSIVERFGPRNADGSALAATLRPGGEGVDVTRGHFFAALSAATVALVAIPSALLGLMVFWVLGQANVDDRLRLLATLVYGLGTSAFPYSGAFVGHQTTAFFLFAAFSIFFAIRKGWLNPHLACAAGFFLGLAAITEYPSALIGGVIALYGIWVIRDRFTAVAIIFGAVPPLLALAFYDLAAFGTPLPVGYLYSALWADVHQVGFVSLTYPRLDSMFGLLFGVDRGLLFLSPFLILALPGYVGLWRLKGWRPELTVLALAPALLLLFTSSSAMWQGGFAVGPRYLVPALPFLGVAAGVGLNFVWSHRPARAIAVLLAIASLAAVWAETIAGQSFPDYTPNPLFELSLPLLAGGNVARNWGMVLGLSGWLSLLPLLLSIAIALGAIWPWNNREVAWFGFNPSRATRWRFAP
jgi:hypothetical protein